MEDKCCCSKESTAGIPIVRIMAKLDALLAKDDVIEAERVLEYWEGEARALKDKRGLLEILSEQIGFYRSNGDEQKGLRAVREALSLLECQGGMDGVANATIYLNCATTLKAFGKVDEALPYYEQVRKIYESSLEKDDFRLAGFYNNYATALAEILKFEEARECYFKAIEVLKAEGGAPEIAVTYANLAQLAYDEAAAIGKDSDEEVEKMLNLAYECLDDKTLARDGNYASTCRKCASAFEFFGYFLQKQELEERAQSIFDSNK